jgi:hypothetical protein
MNGRRVLVVAILIVTMGVLIVVAVRPNSTSRAASTAISCAGSGLVGSPSPANVVLGPATFLGMGTVEGRELEPSGPKGLFADKTFLVVASLKSGTHARITARAIGGGDAGLVYGARPVAAWDSGRYRLDAAQSTYDLSLCPGEPSGFSGGIVTTGPACVQIVVTTDDSTNTTRLGFGGARCHSS